MVFKHKNQKIETCNRFENDVKEYGFQTDLSLTLIEFLFENDVKEYGFQTVSSLGSSGSSFENDVKEYGFQTAALPLPACN